MSSNSKKNSGNSRGYELVFIPYNEGVSDEFTFMTKNSLEEIDSFTTSFNGVKDMVDYINLIYGNYINVIGAYIKRIGSDKRYYVMYCNDIFDKEMVKLKYREYLLSSPSSFRKSSVSRVRLSREDYSSDSNYINSCCCAYFNDGNYRKIRGAYFELKKLGYGSLVTIHKNNSYNIDNEVVDSSSYDYYSDDEELDFLLNKEGGPDWDTIYNLYSLEEINRLVKKKYRSRGKV
jgi:hypothetical protein